MDTMMRKHMERALRVADFARQHPADLPGYQAALVRLQGRLGRIAEAMEEEFGARRAVTAAIVRRTDLRDRLGAGLQMLAGIARTAGVESIGTPIRLRYPGPRRNQVQFLHGARRVVSEAAEQEELLLKYGLPVGYLAELEAGLGEFAGFLRERDEAVRTHVGARLRLKGLVRELKAVVEQMHTINLFRFRSDPELLGVWRSTRALRVVGKRTGSETAETGAPPAVTSGDGQPLALPAGESEARPAA